MMTRAGRTVAIIGGLCSIWRTFPFVLSEKANLDILYTTLGLKRRTVVRGRYLFALLIDLAGGVIGFAFALAVVAILGKPVQPLLALVSVGLMLLIFSLVQAIQFPIIFKMGYSKARFLMYIPFFAIPLIILGLGALAPARAVSAWIDSMTPWLAGHAGLVAVVILAVWAGLMLASYALSARFYRAREF